MFIEKRTLASIFRCRVSMPVPSSACLIESSRSTLLFLWFPFGRYGGPVGAPQFRSGRIHVPDTYWHYGEFFGKSGFTAHRPPIIKKNF